MAIIGSLASGGMKPTTPTIGTASDGGTGTTASVAFTPSSYIGKGTITYTATSSPGSITGTGSSSPITVSGLTTGTAYTFTVAGTTNYGVASASSAASNSVTPANPNLFVAVGGGTKAATSSDGVTWTARTISNASGSGIIYTDKFLAAGSTYSATSTDGITWTSGTDLTSGNNYRYLFGGNGYGIALGYSGKVTYTSNNGSSWTQSTMPTGTGDWFGGAYDYTNKRYLAVTLNNGSVPSTLAATSTNGSTWTQRTLGRSGAWRRAGYGNGRYLVVGLDSSYNPTNTGQTSTDGGSSWSSFSLPESTDWYGVTYGNGVYVAVSGSTGSTTAASSTNGTTWTARTLPAATRWGTPAYGNGIFLAMSGAEGETNTYIASSTNGTTWTQRTMPSNANWSMAAYNSDGGQGQ